MNNTTATPTACQAVAHGRKAAGVLSRGTHSTRPTAHQCGRPALPGDHLCKTHRAKQDKMAAALAARKAARS